MTDGTYPEFKRSGADWFDDVPGHWSVDKFGRAFEVTLGRMIQPSTRGPEDAQVCYLNAASVQPHGLVPNPERVMWANKYEARQYAVNRGDLLVTEGGDVGRSTFYWEPEQVIFQNSLHRVRASRGNDLRLAKYVLDAVRSSGYLEEITNKATIRHLTRDKLVSLKIAVPPHEEQKQIGDYLDAQTSKIDLLIGKQERLIETLAERRQAVISHAVTKGLNPDAPMKESGIEWLGSIPASWAVGALKRYGHLSTGSTPSTDVPENFDNSEGRPWIRPQDIDPAIPGATATLFLSPVGRRGVATVRSGSVLVVSTAWSISKIGYAEVECATNQQITAVQAPICGKYLYFLLQAAKDEIMASMVINRLPIIGNARLGSIQLPIPPAEEQQAIADDIAATTNEIGALSAKAREMIDVLKERRQALISAAVTGKIDVRGLS